MLAQSTSQYYFVLQSLLKLLPSTTLHYKACTKHFPVLLCTTKLAQSTSQYYLVLQIQSLHKVYYFAEGILEVKLPTIWTDEKAEVGRVWKSERREEQTKEDQKRERVRRQKMQVREKIEKSQFTAFFQ